MPCRPVEPSWDNRRPRTVRRTRQYRSTTARKLGAREQHADSGSMTRARRAAHGRARTRCTAGTTTTSGACRWPTTGGCSRSSASRAFKPGLSWLTILRKREAFRGAFADFDSGKVARFDARRVERCCRTPGIVRHRGKIESTINNARRALELRERVRLARGVLLALRAGAARTSRAGDHAYVDARTRPRRSRSRSARS